jgi:sortase A
MSGASTKVARPRRRRFDFIRMMWLVSVVVGGLLIGGYSGAMLTGLQEQQQLTQQWLGEVNHPYPAKAEVDPALKQPVNGVDFAIRVPKLGYFAAVKEGIGAGVLFSSPGHYPETPWPGDPGMVGVAAHNVYWTNFPQLTKGDEIDIETRYGVYKYQVTGSAIVNPDNRTVLIPSANGYHLTLTTCWPLWAGAFATQRYVIFADQVWPLTIRPSYT